MRGVYEAFRRVRRSPLPTTVGAQQATVGCLFGETCNADAVLERGLIAAIHPVAELAPAAIEPGVEGLAEIRARIAASS